MPLSKLKSRVPLPLSGWLNSRIISLISPALSGKIEIFWTDTVWELSTIFARRLLSSFGGIINRNSSSDNNSIQRPLLEIFENDICGDLFIRVKVLELDSDTFPAESIE